MPPGNSDKSLVDENMDVSINADNSQTSNRKVYLEDEKTLRDPEQLLLLHNYDPRYFELVSSKSSKWNAPSKDNSKMLYSSRITVRQKAPSVSQEDISSWFNKLDRNYIRPVIEPYRALRGDMDKALILSISDLHYNLRSSILEAGIEYNCDVAEELYFKVICDILKRTENYSFDKIIFTIGGDQLNIDNLPGTTTKGTPQDTQIGYFEMMENIYKMTVMAVDIIREIAPVEVVLINGNHDSVSGVAIAHYIKAWFRGCPDVTVDTSPAPRKYSVFGKTLFCFAHDADEKKLPALIPDECRAFWSEIDTTEVFLQHLHKEYELSEQNNMRIQRLPTISGRSAWANEKGYSSKRQCKSFVFDKNYGLTDVLYTPIK